MQVTVEYAAQVRQATGISREEVTLAEPCSAAELVRELVARHGEPLGSVLLNSEGQPQRSILAFLGEDQVRLDDASVQLADGDTLTLLSPVSGG